MTPAEWTLGFISLLFVLASIGIGAGLLRRAFLPTFTGAAGLLLDLLLAVSLFVMVSQLLGLFGLFGRAGLLVGAAAILVVALLVGFGGTPSSRGRPRTVTSASFGTPALVALVAVILVAWQWLVPTLDSLESGLYGGDSLWYHMPFSAQIAQTGSITSPLFVDTQYLNWFYPQNSELLHAAGMVLLGDDMASAVLNYLWLGMAALAGWCFGRPWRAELPATLSITVLMSMEIIASRQPGNANNDAMSIALLLVAVAIAALLWSRARDSRDGAPGSREAFGRQATLPLLLIGFALGLALGTKLTVLAPALVLPVGLILLSPAGRRLANAALLAGGALLTGGFWFIRNLVISGNPVPWFDLGPFPQAGELLGREPKPVFDYLADLTIWTEWLAPGLSERLGPLWVALLAGAIVGVVLATASRDRLRRVVGLTGLLAFISYIFIPLGAAGPEGSPTAFSVNLRYMAPALAIGFLLLSLPPDRPAVNPGRWRVGVVVFFGISLLVSFFASGSLAPDGLSPLALLLLFLVIALIPLLVAVFLLSGRGRLVAATVAGWVVLAGVLGGLQNERYLDYRYSSASPQYPTSTYPAIELKIGIGEMNDWARQRQGISVGLSESLGQYYQYGLWGEDFSNQVEAVGREVRPGVYRSPRTCESWIRAVRRGRYDFVVTSARVPDRDPRRVLSAADLGWIGPGQADPVVEADQLTVWRIPPGLDSSHCRGL